ncbi:MAG: HTH domain-containing protein [Spirochaetales bacterium]|nr:HTH domain-containing protein [Spirochaetales bacterium]
MKIDRLLGIINTLSRTETVTAPELARQFEVSRRMINRDIEALCLAGITIVTKQGAGGGISVPDGYKLDRSLLKSGELSDLIAALKGLDSVCGNDDVRILLNKIVSADFGKSCGDMIQIDLASFYKDSLSGKIGIIRRNKMNAEIIRKAGELIESCTEGYVAVVDEKGYPHVATRSVREAEGIYSCYFTTDREGNLAKAISRSGKAAVCFHKGNSNVSLTGDFEIVTDQKIKESVWVDWFINHYPGGPSDPVYFVARFITGSVSLWMDGEAAAFDISELEPLELR